MDEETVQEIKRHFDGTVEATTKEIKHEFALVVEATTKEVKHEFALVAEDMRSHMRVLAEGHADLERRLEDFRGETKREFEETRALIRLSYTELERRIGSLESDVSSLQSRMESVEARLRA